MGISKVKDIREEKVEKKIEREVKKPRAEKVKDIVRLAGTDIDATKPIIQSLRCIKGISHSMAKAICLACELNPRDRLNQLTQSQLEKLENVIREPTKFGIPDWMLNRRKEPERGENLHLTGSQLDISARFDVQKLINLKSWHGVRHMLGLPVRGQRTRSHFRRGKTVGVMRKAARLLMQKAEKEKK